METIYEEVYDERIKQDAKWGVRHDDQYDNSNDWVGLIVKHAGRAVFQKRPTFRKQMIHVAALAIAAIEWCDRRGP